MIKVIEDLEFYSNRTNFLVDSLYDYLPEAEEFKEIKPLDNLEEFVKDTQKALAYSFKLMHFLIWLTPELWPTFLESVEDGFLLLEENNIELTGDTRCKMLFAAYTSGKLLDSDSCL